jgi:RsmE family RNA methyltransferase
MNILLFSADEVSATGQLYIQDARRQSHLAQVLKPNVGDSLRVGQINGDIGQAQVLQHTPQATLLQVELNQPSVAPLALKLLLALPRPKMMRRILQTCATLGVSEITLLNSSKVEKSYWQTPFLQPQGVLDNLILGLEQAGTTHLPLVHKATLFKPFVEDKLDAWAGHSQRLVAHPRHAQNCPPASNQAKTLAIGPEGGFTDYEVDKLQQQGFSPFSLGARILRVETAIPVAIARLSAL